MRALSTAQSHDLEHNSKTFVQLNRYKPVVTSSGYDRKYSDLRPQTEKDSSMQMICNFRPNAEIRISIIKTLTDR
jgi:hypothetical protein